MRKARVGSLETRVYSGAEGAADSLGEAAIFPIPRDGGMKHGGMPNGEVVANATFGVAAGLLPIVRGLLGGKATAVGRLLERFGGKASGLAAILFGAVDGFARGHEGHPVTESLGERRGKLVEDGKPIEAAGVQLAMAGTSIAEEAVEGGRAVVEGVRKADVVQAIAGGLQVASSPMTGIGRWGGELARSVCLPKPTVEALPEGGGRESVSRGGAPAQRDAFDHEKARVGPGNREFSTRAEIR